MRLIPEKQFETQRRKERKEKQQVSLVFFCASQVLLFHIHLICDYLVSLVKTLRLGVFALRLSFLWFIGFEGRVLYFVSIYIDSSRFFGNR
jgi:hypothetical protein